MIANLANIERIIERCEEQAEKMPSDISVKWIYLDIAERIVRKAVKWINSKGQTVDPITHSQFTHANSRFPVSAAQLMRQGKVFYDFSSYSQFNRVLNFYLRCRYFIFCQ